MWGIFYEKADNNRSFFRGVSTDDNEYLFSVVKCGRWPAWPRLNPVVKGYTLLDTSQQDLNRSTDVILPEWFMQQFPVRIIPSANATPITDKLVRIDNSSALAEILGWGTSLDCLADTCMQASGLPVAVGMREARRFRITSKGQTQYKVGYSLPIYSIDLSEPPAGRGATPFH